MRLTKPEKLILTMLAEIHEKLGIHDGTDTKILLSAIYSDNTWALSWEMPGIVAGNAEPNPIEVTRVVNILDMWTFLEDAYSSFNASVKKTIEDQVGLLGNPVRFSGFDGNNESEYLSVANFLVNDMKRFAKFAGRDLNSHSPSIEGSLRMYSAFEPIRKTLGHVGLTSEQVISILKARYNE